MSASLLFFYLIFLQTGGGKNQHQQTQNGVKLGEHSQHHSGTERVVTGTDGTDTISANLGLTNGREQGNKTQSQTYTEDGASCGHGDFGSNLTVQHEETDKAIQTLRRGQGSQAHVGTAGCGILLECTDSGITADGHTVGTADTRQGYAKGNAQIS